MEADNNRFAPEFRGLVPWKAESVNRHGSWRPVAGDSSDLYDTDVLIQMTLSNQPPHCPDQVSEPPTFPSSLLVRAHPLA